MNKANSSALYKIVSEKINSSVNSRITFAEYIDLVLYHPQYGYYGSGAVNIGAKGDFFTASSLGKDFGELLAIQFVEMWHLLNCPNNFTLLEMGAGNGELARDIISYLIANHKEILPSLEYIILEKSPQLKLEQQKRLADLDNVNLTWKNWADIEGSSIIGCCFSNELVDAFPVHQIIVSDRAVPNRSRDRKIKEVYLTLNSGKIVETISEISTNKITEYFELVGIDLLNNSYPEGYRTEVNLAALDWLDIVNSKLQKGYLLTIDYGYPAVKYYHPQRSQGTLQCYYHHRRHNNPYVNLGEQDITTHVNFTALENYGKQHQLASIGLTKLAIFLMSLGIGDRLAELSSGKYNVVEVLQRRDALHQLIDPMGLGGFGVLIQGKNLNSTQQKIKSLVVSG